MRFIPLYFSPKFKEWTKKINYRRRILEFSRSHFIVHKHFLNTCCLTVLGPIEPNLLGRTLTHEHLAVDFEGFYCEPPEEFKPYLKKKICLETVGYVRQYPYSSHENIHFYDEEAHEAVKKDIQLYKKYGGGSIVENSSHGLKRNLELMVDVAKGTGVHIIAGTGHYVHNLQEKDHLGMTVEQLTDLYSREIITGVEVEGVGMVKCGYIGEVGSVYPLHG